MSERRLSAAVTGLLVLGFMSFCRPETSPSCHGAYDLYFVLD
ncbi:ANTXR cell adhesion molecule 2a, partial [Tachysurus ichikawai]